MNKLAVIFTVAYIALSVVIGVVADILKLKSGGSFVIASTLAASFFAAWLFTRSEGREPTPEERKSFSWRALLGATLASGAVTIGYLALTSSLRGMAAILLHPNIVWTVVAVLLFVTVLQYAAIRWSFGWFARRTLRD